MAWSGDTGVLSYAIASDLSGVVATPDGFGIFKTETDALEALILRLESDKTETVLAIAKAKKRKRQLARKGLR